MRRKLKLASVVLSLCFLAWALGLVGFYRTVSTENYFAKNLEPTDAPTDAIVVLTGGQGRLQTGISLLSEGRADPSHLFISGVDKGVTAEELTRYLNLDPDDASCCVALGYEATNTRENAKETLQWMQQHNYQSMQLVTAHYHMPRSLLELQFMMPDYKIIPHPIVPTLFDRHDMASRWSQCFVVFVEYNKYLLAKIRIYYLQVMGLLQDL